MSRAEIFELSKMAIVENNLYFIEDLSAYLPISQATFNEMLPAESKEYKIILKVLESNRTSTKNRILESWANSKNANLQMAFIKLVSSKEVRDILGNKTIIEQSQQKSIEPIIWAD